MNGREMFEAKDMGENSVVFEQIKSKAGELFDLYRKLKLKANTFPFAHRALYEAECALEESVSWSQKAAARGVEDVQAGVRTSRSS